MSDKKFVFDWDDQDDTFNDVSSVASALAATPGLRERAGAVMFGRGHLAGMDDGGVQEANTANRHADALERRRAAKGGSDERHWSEKNLHEMRDRDWRIFREDFSIATRGALKQLACTLLNPNIAAQGGQIPLPLRSWEESPLPPTILEVIEKVGYKEPSPIQRQAIPIGLQNRDLIGIAETGPLL